MEKIETKTPLKVEGVASKKHIEALMEIEDNLNSILGAVQLDDSLSGNIPLPKDLRVAIRCPGKLRNQSKEVERDTWKTNKLFPPMQFAGPRSYTSQYTAPPGK